jgi:hypothetical protein
LSTESADNVELLSAPKRTVDLEEGADTRVVFRFLVDGVTLGFGDLVIEIAVQERGAGGASAGVGGSGSGEGGGAGGGTFDDACNQCLDDTLLQMSGEPVNQNCSAVAECAAVRECVVASNCYQTDKSPSICYCGVDVNINDCQDPNFVPQGVCADVIKDAFVFDQKPTDNATVVGQMAAASTTSGHAFGVLIPATQIGICIDECTL